MSNPYGADVSEHEAQRLRKRQNGIYF